MDIYKQTNNKKEKLLLIFSGWSASPLLFKGIEADEDTDIWIGYNYQNLAFTDDLSGYREIRIIAWSLGVWAASIILDKQQASLPINGAIAINGTPYPVHDTYGIPETIFRGTLENITPAGMYRFNRRMCGSKDILQQYETIPPRPIEEIKEELHVIYQTYRPMETSLWTSAILSANDLIFPIQNLRNYWCGRCPVTEIEAPHYPFYRWKQWNELWKQ
jgi:uncharacterized protein HI_1552